MIHCYIRIFYGIFNCQLHICKISTEACSSPTITHSIVDLSWAVFIHGHKLSDTCTFSSIPPHIKTGAAGLVPPPMYGDASLVSGEAFHCQGGCQEFMWRLCSSLDQGPPVVTPSHIKVSWGFWDIHWSSSLACVIRVVIAIA